MAQKNLINVYAFYSCIKKYLDNMQTNNFVVDNCY